jgi:FHA domain
VQQLTRRVIATLRAWFDPPIEPDARPLEIREAIVDLVERRAEPAAAGRRVLTHNHVTVTVVTRDKDERAALSASLCDIESAIRARLAELRCQVPPGFEVEIQYARKPKAGWAPTQRLGIDFASRAVTRRPAGHEPSSRLRIVVVRGQATQRSYLVSDPLVRIGRTAAPVDHAGRPRHNHVVFVENGDEHSTTVGRAHASIQYDHARREYRLFDDGSHNGTRVVRGATTLSVVARDPVGVRLLSGDEVQFGTAVVTIEIDSDRSS